MNIGELFKQDDTTFTVQGHSAERVKAQVTINNKLYDVLIPAATISRRDDLMPKIDLVGLLREAQPPEQPDNWPKHSDELSRKALASLQESIDRLHKGEISDKEAFLIADALYDTIVGLANQDDVSTIYEVRCELKKRCQQALSSDWGQF